MVIQDDDDEDGGPKEGAKEFANDMEELGMGGQSTIEKVSRDEMMPLPTLPFSRCLPFTHRKLLLVW